MKGGKADLVRQPSCLLLSRDRLCLLGRISSGETILARSLCAWLFLRLTSVVQEYFLEKPLLADLARYL